MSLTPQDRPAPTAVVQTAGDRELALAETWSERPVALFFLRHFG